MSLLRIFIALWFLAGTEAARASPVELRAYVFSGASDPSGVDDAFLRLGQARGAATARDTPGQLAEDAHARLQHAVDAFTRLQLPDALARLDALEGELAASGGAGLGRGELIDVFAHRAAARLGGGDEPGAWDDLLQVAAFSPPRPLDPARFAPRLVETARRAAQSLSASGRLVVSATPPDARVAIDGLVLGRGRIEVMVPSGRHFVRAERSGLVAAGRAVDVGADVVTVALALAPAPAPLPATFAQRGGLLGARRVVGAWVEERAGRALLELAVIDTATREVRARTRLALDDLLTTGALADAIDRLEPPPPPPRPWYRRAAVWAVVGGVVAGAAVAIGLGVGLSGDREPGFAAHVNLGAAR